MHGAARACPRSTPAGPPAPWRRAARKSGLRPARCRRPRQSGPEAQISRCGAQARQDLRLAELSRLSVAPTLILDQSLLEAAFTDDDSVGNADELDVGEHHTRPLVAVIEQHLETG